MFVGLNPSTADGEKDDPTIRRAIGFAKRWGFGRLTMLNLFAFRATDPRVLLAAPDPIGHENDRTLTEYASHANLLVCCWGNWGAHRGRWHDVCRLSYRKSEGRHRRMEDEFCCLGLTKRLQPRHILYAPYACAPIAYLSWRQRSGGGADGAGDASALSSLAAPKNITCCQGSSSNSSTSL